MILNAHERLKFMEYCKRQSESAKAIAEQMAKGMPTAIAETMSKRERAKAAAYGFVAMDLASVCEEFVVGGEDIGEQSG